MCALQACSDDDDDNGGVSALEQDPNSIIGTWEYTYEDGTAIYNFKTNGKCVYGSTHDGYAYTYKTVGNFLILKQDGYEIYLYEIEDGIMKCWYYYEGGSSGFSEDNLDESKVDKTRNPSMILYKKLEVK